MEEEHRLESLAQEVRERIEGQEWEAVRALLGEVHPADIADVLDRLEPDQRLKAFALLESEVASEVLDEAGPEATRTLMGGIDPQQLSQLLEEMPMDDAAELLEELRAEEIRELLELMEPAEAKEVGAALAYPEDSAGRLMSEKFVRVRRPWTVQETLESLRGVDPDAELFYYLYAVDEEDRLVGVLPLRSLLTASPGQTIRELIEPEVISVSVTTDREEVARVVAKYDFLAVPVVDESQRLVGIVTVDDVVDILAEESTEDIQLLGGSQPLDEPYTATGVLEMVRKRVFWLLLLFVGGIATASVLRYFEAELTRLIALAFFVPLLIGTGGNSGSQAVTLVVRALALGEIGLGDARRVMARELATGLILGLLVAAVGFAYAFWLSRDLNFTRNLALTVAISMVAIVTWANLVGSVVPLAARKVGLDPAVLSAPLISTVVDATGLFIYFTVAGVILQL